jgi:AcrR family transcriptional regulator
VARFSENSERTLDIANTIVRLLDRGGMSAVTMRNVARDVGMSLGTLTGHVATRERMLVFCARDVGRRHLDDLRRNVRQHGLAGLLPGRSHEVLMTRGWLAIREWAREYDALAHVVADIDAQERHLMLMTLVPGVPEDWRQLHRRETRPADLGDLPDEAALDAFQAAVHGIRDRMCARKPMPAERAQRALEAAAAFARRSATTASGSEAE